jgi:hypothetical protein
MNKVSEEEIMRWNKLFAQEDKLASVQPNTVRWKKKGCATCKPIVAQTRQVPLAQITSFFKK